MATEDEINRLCESCGRALEYDFDNEVWYCPYDCVPKYVIDTLNSINLEDLIDPDAMPPPETISEKQDVQEPLRHLSKSIYLENTTLLPDSKEEKVNMELKMRISVHPKRQ